MSGLAFIELSHFFNAAVRQHASDWKLNTANQNRSIGVNGRRCRSADYAIGNGFNWAAIDTDSLQNCSRIGEEKRGAVL